MFLDQHEEGCTPLRSCRICNAVNFLRSKLNQKDMGTLREILTVSPFLPKIDHDTPWNTFRSELSSRAYLAVANTGTKTLGDLLKFTESELLRLPNFGRTSLSEVVEFLRNKGHYLGELPPTE